MSGQSYMFSLVAWEVIRIFCFLQIGILTHQAWNQIKKKANAGEKKEIIQSIFKVFDDPESRGYVLCDVFHSFVCFVVNVQSSCQRVSRHFFHIVFLIFSILSPFFLLSFTTKENQILIIFFHYQGHNFFIVFLSIPKLVYVIFLLCVFFSPFLCPGFSDP